MSEPENISTQEKLDAWFASLQLDKSAPLTKKEIFFRWFIRNIAWITPIACFLLPIGLYWILFIFERYTNLYWEYGYTKSEWFLFFGSYLGGAATLSGVLLTILHTKKVQLRQEKIASIEREYEAQTIFLRKINIPQFCSLKYQDFCAVFVTDKIQHILQLQDILLSISRYRDDINSELVRVSTLSDIFGRELACESCKTPCNRYKIKKEFLNIFIEEHQKNMNLLNRLNIAIRLKLNLVNLMDIYIRDTQKITPEEDCERCKNLKEDLEYEEQNRRELDSVIQEHCKLWHSEHFTKLITLIKFYRDEQIKVITHPCPYQQQLF